MTPSRTRSSVFSQGSFLGRFFPDKDPRSGFGALLRRVSAVHCIGQLVSLHTPYPRDQALGKHVQAFVDPQCEADICELWSRRLRPTNPRMKPSASEKPSRKDK